MPIPTEFLSSPEPSNPKPYSSFHVLFHCFDPLGPESLLYVGQTGRLWELQGRVQGELGWRPLLWRHGSDTDSKNTTKEKMIPIRTAVLLSGLFEGFELRAVKVK